MLRVLNSLSLTFKLATLIVVINLVGIVGLATYNWVDQSRTMLGLSQASWGKDTNQFASLAAGGVKWGKADAVAETYTLYRDNPDLDLVQFAALTADLKMVNSWRRDGVEGLAADDAITAALKTPPEALVFDESNLGSGVVSVIAPLPRDKAGKISGYVYTTWSAQKMQATVKRNAMVSIGAQTAVITVAIFAFLIAMRSLVGTPLGTLSARISALQAGDLETPVVYQKNGDEIGFLARALEQFRRDAIATLADRQRAEEQQRTIDSERARNTELTEESARTQRLIMERVGDALAMLAQGKLAAQLQDLGPEFTQLRQDFNAMVESVTAAISSIKTASIAVENGAGELADQTQQLAKRTEQQAATLEETAAALDEVTVTVQTSSRKAEQAGQMVGEAKAEARESAEVVRRAIGAMDRIQNSSSQIGQIIGVIDEIAFQTNLLALNAGVEAARAGEAGKGFAVVAQEVRELAQRSANAAKEIKQLVAVSSTEVAGGVSLVNETGEALLKIEGRIGTITETIMAMVASYREQSSGLQEINQAINGMDQATQQNAAMVEETSAACHELLTQSRVLQQAANRFDLDGAGEEMRRVA
ncbi:chemotaxis protein [Rhizobium sp. Root274]|uniref:methyl-accepting chemotaxis protein n=1 Tax=unclassified Rhizobium TaxID=2613769 RepID=UPI000713EBA8|nr:MULTISPECIES: HAMP domain-containing methyl-accepting chemotaxis protein [unclassified Rhizobium]KQW27431.1 chemotaxis protein [Rhizobium sp. Root1240]KRD27667.1 chemotaxis protein [Rhizobium sp. Root274]